jgi:hypothetical protein
MGEEEESRWIEAEALLRHPSASSNREDDVDGQDLDVGNLFADPDPWETFDYRWNVEVDDHHHRVIQLSVTGHKAELGQTLHSTGLTIINNNGSIGS